MQSARESQGQAGSGALISAWRCHAGANSDTWHIRPAPRDAGPRDAGQMTLSFIQSSSYSWLWPSKLAYYVFMRFARFYLHFTPASSAAPDCSWYSPVNVPCLCVMSFAGTAPSCFSLFQPSLRTISFWKPFSSEKNTFPPSPTHPPLSLSLLLQLFHFMH